MNRDRVLMIANAIEQHTIVWLGFNMAADIDTIHNRHSVLKDNSGHGCGTVACIAGHAHVIIQLERDPTISPLKLAVQHVDFEEIANWLGLDMHMSDCLFYGWYSHEEDEHGAQRLSPMPLAYIAAEQAVRTLRKLADTGEVDWSC